MPNVAQNTRVIPAVRFSERDWDSLQKLARLKQERTRYGAIIACLTVDVLNAIEPGALLERTPEPMLRSLTNVRVLDEVYVAIEGAAARCNATVADVVRHCLYWEIGGG